jgi:hypothetical protein
MIVYPTRLLENHRHQLEVESGISPEIAAERGYYTARSRSEVPEAFAGYQRRLGLVVQMFSPDGITRGWQLRPDKPRKKGPKYETPSGSSPVVDVHPRMLEEARHGDGLIRTQLEWRSHAGCALQPPSWETMGEIRTEIEAELVATEIIRFIEEVRRD